MHFPASDAPSYAPTERTASLTRSACPPRPFGWLDVGALPRIPRPSIRPDAALLGNESGNVRPEGLQIAAQSLQFAP